MIDAPRAATREAVYTNYRLQLPDRELLGTLVVRDGAIAEIDAGIARHGIDGDGALMLPGLVELHTDNLERALAPRPGIRWPMDAAVLYHDGILAAAGITTVFDAISIGDVADGPTGAASPRVTHHRTMVDAITSARTQGGLRADHHIHLRCELVYEDLLSVAGPYVESRVASLISVMDHTPGQRQFVDLKKFEQYYVGKHGISPAEIHAFIARRQADHLTYAPENRARMVALAHAHGVPVASHDDATVEHVEEALRDGVAIAEFPTTRLAAETARAADLEVVAGAPNLVLRGSHSGNVSAGELIGAGLATIISSDYVPQSLLHGVFIVAALTGAPLHQAMRVATTAPARAVGLTDRGEIAVGKRADLIVVDGHDAAPRTLGVFVAGERVA